MIRLRPCSTLLIDVRTPAKYEGLAPVKSVNVPLYIDIQNWWVGLENPAGFKVVAGQCEACLRSMGASGGVAFERGVLYACKEAGCVCVWRGEARVPSLGRQQVLTEDRLSTPCVFAQC